MGLAEDTSRSRISLIVPRTLVKKVKNVLEAHGKLDKQVKIRPARLEEQKEYPEGASTETRPDSFLIPTKLSVGTAQLDSDALPVKWDLLRSLELTEDAAEVILIVSKQTRSNHGLPGCEGNSEDCAIPHEALACETPSMNPLARVIDHWLHQSPHEEPKELLARSVVLSHNWTYMVYPPLLLLPPTALSNLSSIFASKVQYLPKDLSSLWCLLSTEFKVSHIALNAPIPASSSKESSLQATVHPEANILRSPTGLTPLYGDFGPALPLYQDPNAADFASAFWCKTRQNGIHQTWAPRYTMFSRGNISEKARILNLETLNKERLGSPPEDTSAVDLYAGIGYFVFSYAKARVGKVLCWEINPWSVEGLRRGAKRNRWGMKVIEGGLESNETIKGEDCLIVFQESNEHAVERIAAIRGSIPPVRHVNCGFLPSSKDSWETSMQVLDPTGGWIHAHENIATNDIERRKEEVVGTFKRLITKHRHPGPGVQWKIECERVAKVKSYAPGVLHCVLDISVSLIKSDCGKPNLRDLDLSAPWQ